MLAHWLSFVILRGLLDDPLLELCAIFSRTAYHVLTRCKGRNLLINAWGQGTISDLHLIGQRILPIDGPRSKSMSNHSHHCGRAIQYRSITDFLAESGARRCSHHLTLSNLPSPELTFLAISIQTASPSFVPFTSHSCISHSSSSQPSRNAARLDTALG